MNEELYHHGVKGQKWGVIRFSKKDRINKNRQSKKISDMSDDELRKAINRKRLEKRYNDLTKTSRRSERETFGKLLDVAQKGSNLKKMTKGVDDSKSKIGITVGRTAKKNADTFESLKRGKNGKSMSDDELRKAVNRLQLEKDYRSLHPTTKEIAIQKTKDSLLVVDSLIGTAVTITAIAKSPAGQKAIASGRNFICSAAAAAIIKKAAKNL